MIDDINLHPISGPSVSDHLSPESTKSYYLSFEPGIWNDIVIQFRERVRHEQLLHDIELFDTAGLEYELGHTTCISSK